MSRACKHGVVGMRSPEKMNRCQCVQCTEELKARDRARYYEKRDEKLAYQKRRFEENKPRILEANRSYRARNARELNAKNREWYAANSKQDNLRRSAHYVANKVATRKRMDAYYAANKARIAASNQKFNAARALRIPDWFGELDELVVECAYELCDQRREVTGIEWEVDHMLPLRARLVSGLHTWGNVQVIPKTMNRAKRHREILTSPGEWIGSL